MIVYYIKCYLKNIGTAIAIIAGIIIVIMVATLAGYACGWLMEFTLKLFKLI